MSYQIGFCPQCGAQIAVRDSDGRMNSFKPNWRQIDMKFEDGHIMRSPVCSDCLVGIDYAKIMAAITADGSQASTSDGIEQIRDAGRGLPVSHEVRR